MARLKRLKQRRARQSGKSSTTAARAAAVAAAAMEDAHKDISESIIAFGQWLKRNGFRNETGLQIYTSSTYGRAIFTGARRLAAGECVLALPTKLLITGAILRAYKPKIYGHFTDDTLCLIVFLMTELDDPESPWSDYFGVLPDKHHSLPCAWPPWDIKRALATIPESFKDAFLTDAAKMSTTYHRIRQIVDTHHRDLHYTKADLLSWDLFEWAYCTFYTRSVHLPVAPFSQHSNQIALIPYFDFFNHSPDADVWLQFSASSQELQLYTRKPIDRYTQVFIRYNNYSNRQLLQHYGYTAVEEAPFIEVLQDADINSTYIKPSEQDLIPVSFHALQQFLSLKEAEVTSRYHQQSVSYTKRLSILLEIDFLKHNDIFELTWPSTAYFQPTTRSLVKLRNNLDVLRAPEVPEESFTLDWRLDLTLQLLVRPQWDATSAIKRLIYTAEDTPTGSAILAASQTTAWRHYYRLWIGLIDWLLKKDYSGIKLDGSSSLEQYQASVVHYQVRAILGNEIALLVCLRKDLKDRRRRLLGEVVEEEEAEEEGGSDACVKLFEKLHLSEMTNGSGNGNGSGSSSANDLKF